MSDEGGGGGKGDDGGGYDGGGYDSGSYDYGGSTSSIPDSGHYPSQSASMDYWASQNTPAPTYDYNPVPAADFSYLDNTPAPSFVDPGASAGGNVPGYGATDLGALSNPTGGYESAPYIPPVEMPVAGNDYSSIAPNDFSNFDYLAPSTPEQAPVGTFAPEQATVSGGEVVPGYGVTDLSGLQPSGGGTPPSGIFDPGIPAGATPTSGNATGMPDSLAGFVTPAADIPNALPPVVGENGQPASGWTGTPAPPPQKFSAADVTFNGPAGASGSPDLAYLNAAPIGDVGPQQPLSNTGAVGATGGAGPSAAGNVLQGAGGGAAANDLSQSKLKKEGTDNFLSNFGIKNPLGTAIAAGALGYGMLQGNKTANASTTGTGAIPAANMAAIAAPLIAQGQQMTTAGIDTVKAGTDKLNTLATDLPATTQPGKDAIANSITDLKATAAALPEQVAPGQAVQAAAAQNLETQAAAIPAAIKPGQAIQAQAANDLQAVSASVAQASPVGQKIILDSANNLTQLAADTVPTAQTLMAKGTDLTQYIGTGTLPPEMMAQVDAQVQADKAKLISGYAARGMPTNPAKNSSLRMELESLDRQRLITINSMSAQLATTGTNIVGAGGNLNQQAGGFNANAGNLGGTYGNIVNQTASTQGNLNQAAGGIGTSMVTGATNAQTAAGNLTANAGQIGTSMVSGANQVANTQGNLEQAAGGAGATLAKANQSDAIAAGSLEQQAAGLGQGLVTSGLAASGMSASTYNQLATLDAAQAKRTQEAIAAMAAALNGGTPTKTTTTTTANV